MGCIKLKIHPLFYLLGLYYAFTNKLLLFVVCTLTAVIHELGHSLVAGDRGYRLNKITLMPFGAVVSGESSELNFKDELIIAFAGPITNLLVAIFFIAFWWIVPESYPYTELAVSANLSMALINCIPAYPLDGGRILSAFLSIKVRRKRAIFICKLLGIIFSIIILCLFILSIFNSINISILFFALFIFFGAISREKDIVYLKIYKGISAKRLSKGVIIKRFAVDKSTTVKRLLTLLDEDCINEVDIYEGERCVYTLKQEKIKKIMEKGELLAPIEKYIAI
jgi:Zn-dependent protease